MLRTYRDVGIIFKQVNVNEADKIVSMLTRNHGRVDAVVKGVRRISSKMGPSIDLFTRSKFFFAKGKNLDIITESQILESYLSLKHELVSNFKLFFISELLDKFLQTGLKQKELYVLTIELLDNLHEVDSFSILGAFALKLMALQGFEPNTHYCLVCGDELGENEKRYLSHSEVGFNCQKEHIPKKDPISDQLLKVIRFLLKSDITDIKKLELEIETDLQLKHVVMFWLESVIEKEIKSKRYL